MLGYASTAIPAYATVAPDQNGLTAQPGDANEQQGAAFYEALGEFLFSLPDLLDQASKAINLFDENDPTPEGDAFAAGGAVGSIGSAYTGILPETDESTANATTNVSQEIIEIPLSNGQGDEGNEQAAALQTVMRILDEQASQLSSISPTTFEQLRKEFNNQFYQVDETRYLAKTDQGWYEFNLRHDSVFVGSMAYGAGHFEDRNYRYEIRYFPSGQGRNSALQFQDLEEKEKALWFLTGTGDFVLKALPFGSLSDYLVNGHGGETNEDKLWLVVTTIGDATFVSSAFVSIAGKTVQATRAARLLNSIDLAANVGAAGFDAYKLATSEDGKAGYAGDFVLRMVILSLSASNRKALNDALENLKAPRTGAYTAGFDDLGRGLGKLAESEIIPTRNGLKLIREHLAKMDPSDANRIMLQRIEDAIASGRRLTGADAVFYTHELTERGIMIQKLAKHGGNYMDYYQDAHRMTLEQFGNSPFSVYHPEAILGDEFLRTNSNWLKFWGIEQ